MFSKEKGDFYASVNATLTDTSAVYKNGNIVIDGRFTSDMPVTKAIVILNTEGRSGYNQIGLTRPIHEKGFHASISTKELFKTDSTDYGLKIWLVFQNGQRKNFKLPSFSFENGPSDIGFH